MICRVSIITSSAFDVIGLSPICFGVRTYRRSINAIGLGLGTARFDAKTLRNETNAIKHLRQKMKYLAG